MQQRRSRSASTQSKERPKITNPFSGYKSFKLPTFSSEQKVLPETRPPIHQKKKVKKKRDGEKKSTIIHNIPVTNQEGSGGVVIF